MAATASFGLYLGNTSACLAIYKDENVDVVANHAGDRVTPAAISFHESEQIAGLPAKAGIFRNGPNTVLNNKRLMNKNIDSDELEDAINTSTSKIVNDTNLIHYALKVGDKIEKVTVDKISTLLFGAMYDISISAAHDDDEHNVVLCVPSRFNNESIKIWSSSAEKAGFKVQQVISEPIATCIAHGLGQDKTKNELVLVYRVGGISSDISLVNISGGAFTIESSKYYPKLGGQKLTNLMTVYLAEEFRNKYKIDPNDSRRSISKLKFDAEKCKHVLSTMSTAHCFVESLCEGVDFSHNITRARFENIIGPHLPDYLKPIDDILNISNKKNIDIKKIILCGGTMKLPKLQESIGSLFPNGEILTSRWSHDETMAVGAAIQSSQLASRGIKDCELNSTTVELHSLAKTITVKIDNTQSIVIPANTVVPIKIQTIIDLPNIKSEKIEIKVFEGEDNDNKIMQKIGLISLKINGPGKFKFDTDLTESNFIIHITESSTGKKSSFRFAIHDNS